ncbi:hypothetical protein C8J56DRAFT_1089253 [Mycena floridula]|nr:hypothetical protein C8J56DRAFT_1089253 [Mycena floridula]
MTCYNTYKSQQGVNTNVPHILHFVSVFSSELSEGRERVSVGIPSQASAEAAGAPPSSGSASSGSSPSLIPLQPDRSLKVDKYLRVLGSDGGMLGGRSVFEIGDIVQYPDLEMGTYRRVEHWNVAGNHGRTIGTTIASRGEPDQVTVTFLDPKYPP